MSGAVPWGGRSITATAVATSHPPPHLVCVADELHRWLISNQAAYKLQSQRFSARTLSLLFPFQYFLYFYGLLVFWILPGPDLPFPPVNLTCVSVPWPQVCLLRSVFDLSASVNERCYRAALPWSFVNHDTKVCIPDYSIFNSFLLPSTLSITFQLHLMAFIIFLLHYLKAHFIGQLNVCLWSITKVWVFHFQMYRFNGFALGINSCLLTYQFTCSALFQSYMFHTF